MREGRFCATLFQTIRNSLILNGEMSEWSIEHAWKACVRETVPWVRIPLSPPVLTHSHEDLQISSVFLPIFALDPMPERNQETFPVTFVKNAA